MRTSNVASKLVLLLQFLACAADCLKTEVIMISTVVRYGTTTFTPANTVITKYGDQIVDPNSRPPSQMLTSTGKRQMYNFGQYLWTEYSQLFNRYPLTEANTLIKTSAKQRTIEAAFSVVTGMLNNSASIPVPWNSEKVVPRFKGARQYPKSGGALPAGWNIFPIKSTSDEYDTLLNLNSKDVCPNKNQILTEKQTKEINTYNPEKLRTSLTEIFTFYGISLSGHDLTNTTYCFSAYLLISSDYMNRKDAFYRPEGATAGIWTFVKNCYEAHIMTLYGSDTDLQMAGSPLALALLGNITKTLNETIEPGYKVSTDSTTRLVLVSAQEKSILPLLRILGLINPDCVNRKYKEGTDNGGSLYMRCVEFPHPGSALVIELHQALDLPEQQSKKNQSKVLNITNYSGFYLKVRYNDEYYDIGDKKHPDKLMPFDYFNKTFVSAINLDWKSDCGIESSTLKPTSVGSWLLLLATTNVIMALAVLGLFAYLWRSRDKDNAPDRMSDMGSLGDLEDPLNNSNQFK